MAHNPFESRIKVTGYSTPDGERGFVVRSEGHRAFVDIATARGNQSDAIRSLANQGVFIAPGDPAKALAYHINRTSAFPETALLRAYGWAPGCFVKPDGDVVGASDDPPLNALPRTPNKCTITGTLEEWRSEVAAPAVTQPLLLTGICIALAPPLRALCALPMPNAFELVGSGTDLVARIAASVVGSPTAEGYLLDIHHFMTDPDASFAQHADMPLIVTGSDLFHAGQPQKQLEAGYKALVCGAGSSSGLGRTPRCVSLTTSAQPFVAALGESGLVELASTYQITLIVDPGKRYGVFDRLPKSHANATSFAAALDVAVEGQHGTAMQCFLERLVAARRADEVALRVEIAGLIGSFRKRCRIDMDDAVQVRTANAFGLLYAAGSLARGYGVLPKDAAVGPTLMRVYRSRRWRPLPLQPIVERLRVIAARRDVMQIVGRSMSISRATFEEANLFLKKSAKGDELWIRPGYISLVLRDYRTLLAKPSAQALLVKEGERFVTKRSHGGMTDRFYCFTLPPQE